MRMKSKTKQAWSQVIHDGKLRVVVLGAVLLMAGVMLPWTDGLDGLDPYGLGVLNSTGALLWAFALLAVASSVSIHANKMKNLEILDMSECTSPGPTDEGIKELTNLPKLWDVNLWSTKVSDGAVEAISGIKTVTRLNLNTTVGWLRDFLVGYLLGNHKSHSSFPLAIL